jgi:hypothetical protein
MIMKKNTLINTIPQLPDEFTIDELLEKLIVMDKIEKGEKEIEEGKVLNEDQAKYRLKKWLK